MVAIRKSWKKRSWRSPVNALRLNRVEGHEVGHGVRYVVPRIPLAMGHIQVRRGWVQFVAPRFLLQYAHIAIEQNTRARCKFAVHRRQSRVPCTKIRVL